MSAPRPAIALDRFPTLSELREKYLARTGRPLELADDRRAPKPAASPVTVRAASATGGTIEAVLLAGDVMGTRLGDTLHLTLPFPPRTKKNGTTIGIRQKKAYRVFRQRVVRALEPLKGRLRLPLPEAHYNIAAIYYVDRRGELADKVGLDQGLYDALENAGVITNDWQLRTADGTRVVFGAAQPRVEITITPIPLPPRE